MNIEKNLKQISDRLLKVIASVSAVPAKAPAKKVAKKAEPAAEPKVRKASPKKMQCRHEGCKNRSKGPRFHFLCTDHIGDAQ